MHNFVYGYQVLAGWSSLRPVFEQINARLEEDLRMGRFDPDLENVKEIVNLMKEVLPEVFCSCDYADCELTMVH